MAQERRFSPHDAPYDSNYSSYQDRFAEPVDLDTFGSQHRSPHPARTIARREEFPAEDSVPLFLSGPDDEPRISKFARPKNTGSRLLKTAAFAIAALVATFVAVKDPFTVFANATASLMGSPDTKLAPAPATPPRQVVATAAAAVPPTVPSANTVASPALAPSRDEIALALRSAHQSQPPLETSQPVATAAPAAVVPAPPAARRLDAEELANLMTRARTMLATGDISAARLLLERAAEAQEASAALMLAQTYDPTVLGTQDIRNITADPAQARTWYQRASQLGSADAQRRLSQLQ